MMRATVIGTAKGVKVVVARALLPGRHAGLKHHQECTPAAIYADASAHSAYASERPFQAQLCLQRRNHRQTPIGSSFVVVIIMGYSGLMSQTRSIMAVPDRRRCAMVA